MARANLIYVGDPLCSWCYGFGPEIIAVESALRERAGLRVILGGLRPYTNGPMDTALKRYLREAWQAVARASGLPFGYGLLERDDFVYDTEPACRAVVTARSLSADAALPVFLAIQEAFYRDNRDPTREDTLADAARAGGLDRDEFLVRFGSEPMKQVTRQDFAASRNLGVRGFPTVLLSRDGDLTLIASGFTRADRMIAAADQALAVA
ncbi:MAG TPA: DsbA family protein [Burkholderiales bacterium]